MGALYAQKTSLGSCTGTVGSYRMYLRTQKGWGATERARALPLLHRGSTRAVPASPAATVHPSSHQLDASLVSTLTVTLSASHAALCDT